MTTENEKFEEILVGEEVLLRQVHPSFVQDGRIGSSVFKAFPKDKGHLSCSVGSKITAIEAHRVYTKVKTLSSDGIASIKNHFVGNLKLKTYYSPSKDGPSPDADAFDQAHSHIDYTSLASRREEESSAKLLAQHARDNKVTFFTGPNAPQAEASAGAETQPSNQTE